MNAGKILKVFLLLLAVSVTGYILYTVVAYRFTDSDYNKLRAEAVTANGLSLKVEEAAYANVPDDGEYIVLSDSKASFDKECSDITYPAKQGYKRIVCQHEFNVFIAMSLESSAEVEQPLIEDISRAVKADLPSLTGDLITNRYYEWELDDSKIHLDLEIHLQEDKWKCS